MDLLDALEQTDVRKIRLMYCYPELVTKELLDRVESDPKLVKYLDIPMQHASDRVLKAMRRRSSQAQLAEMMDYVRDHTSITVRSTFMVGFPGETEEDVDALVAFLEKYRIEYAGFFPYYREEGTPAYDFPEQVPAKVKNQRLKRVEKVQSRIMQEIADTYIGRTIEVYADNIDYDRGCFVGHADWQHPEIDNKVYFKADFVVNCGQRYTVRIEGRDKLDLVGVAI